MTRSAAPLSMEYILLGLIAPEPVHGYDLHKKLTGLEEDIALVWRLKQSLLYALLDRLEKDGLLGAETIAGETHPPRKEYHLTALGRQAFLTWVVSPVQHGRDMRQEFLAKLYFAQKDGPQAALELIEAQKEVCAEWLVGLDIQFTSTHPKQRYKRMLYQFRISQIQAMLEWLEYCRREL